MNSMCYNFENKIVFSDGLNMTIVKLMSLRYFGSEFHADKPAY